MDFQTHDNSKLYNSVFSSSKTHYWKGKSKLLIENDKILTRWTWYSKETRLTHYIPAQQTRDSYMIWNAYHTPYHFHHQTDLIVL